VERGGNRGSESSRIRGAIRTPFGVWGERTQEKDGNGPLKIGEKGERVCGGKPGEGSRNVSDEVQDQKRGGPSKGRGPPGESGAVH